MFRISTIPQDQAARNRKRQQTTQLKLNYTTAQVAEYEKLTSDLRQQLSDVRAENAQLHIQLNVTKFQLAKAEAAIETIHHSFEQRELIYKSSQDELTKVQSERTLLEVQLAELTSANSSNTPGNPGTTGSDPALAATDQPAQQRLNN